MSKEFLAKHGLNKIATRFEFMNSAIDESVTDMYLYGDVGDSWWSDGITAKGVLAAMDSIDTDTINVHINSYGGDTFEGIAINNILRQSNKTIIGFVDGIAASAGSLILMGCDKIIVPANSQIMIHNPWTYAAGNADELEVVVNQLRSTEKSLIATYSERFVGTQDELVELLKAESFLDAEQAVALGLADEIYQTTQEEPPEPVDIAAKLMSKYATKPIAAQAQPEQKKNDEPNVLQNFMNIFEGGNK